MAVDIYPDEPHLPTPPEGCCMCNGYGLIDIARLDSEGAYVIATRRCPECNPSDEGKQERASNGRL